MDLFQPSYGTVSRTSGRRLITSARLDSVSFEGRRAALQVGVGPFYVNSGLRRRRFIINVPAIRPIFRVICAVVPRLLQMRGSVTTVKAGARGSAIPLLL